MTARFVPSRSGEAMLLHSSMVNEGTVKVARELLKIAEDRIRETTHGNGDLERSGHIENDGNTVQVVFDDSKAALVHEGTRPHVITAKPGSTLHWKDESGQDHFAKKVNHPGTKPNRYLNWAVDKKAQEDS